MKLQFDIQGIRFGQGQKVQADVLASGKSGSMVSVNGIPISTEKPLPLGRRLVGTVDKVDGNQATISLAPEPAVDLDPAFPERWLALEDLPIDPANKALVELLRSLNIPLTTGILSHAREMLDALQLPLDKKDLEALGLMLLRNLPKGVFSLVKEYLAGGIRLGSLLSQLPEGERAALAREWADGKLLQILSKIHEPETLKELAGDLKDKLPEEVVKNLAFQEALSVMPQKSEDGRMYFQWPMYWHGADTPDTLEGEAFYAGSDEKERGFSLRVLVQPPRLGAMEIGIHQIKSSLWVHFGTDADPLDSPISGIFPDLTVGLEKFGWKNVRLTVGARSPRSNFFGNPEPEARLIPAARLDIKA